MKRNAAFLVTVVASLCAGCASTKIVDTWKDPGFKGPIEFKKTVVFGFDNDRYSRNIAEDVVVERIGADRAVASHDLLSEEDRASSAAVKAKLKQAGVDGAILLALAGTRSGMSRDAGADDAEPFQSYYDRASAFTMSEYGANTSTTYRVETRIYDVAADRVIWRALSETVDPRHVHQATQDIAKAVGSELRKQKLIR